MCSLCDIENERPDTDYRPSEIGYDPYNSADTPYWSYATSFFKDYLFPLE